MAGILLLLLLCAVMALASFFVGALPLSLTLSHSQLRLISSVGVGILIGTSLIIIIPEGIEAVARPPPAHTPGLTKLAPRSALLGAAIDWRDSVESVSAANAALQPGGQGAGHPVPPGILVPESVADKEDNPASAPPAPAQGKDEHAEQGHGYAEIPAFEVGFSMVLGFVLMFLIDRLPRHATDTFQPAPQTTHMSLDNLGGDGACGDAETDGFLGSLAPGPRRARGLATTIGLVIHAAADGIAMGASSATSDTKLGLIIFIAIMVHKAPAAFGLTSVLLRQGLSKRAARGHLIVFSLAAPMGALSTWLLIALLGGRHLEGAAGQWWTGMLLLFSGGTFLYVAMHAMQEDGGSHGHDHGSGTNGYADGASASQRKAKGPQMRDTVATVVGMFLPLLTQFGHHH